MAQCDATDLRLQLPIRQAAPCHPWRCSGCRGQAEWIPDTQVSSVGRGTKSISSKLWTHPGLQLTK